MSPIFNVLRTLVVIVALGIPEGYSSDLKQNIAVGREAFIIEIDSIPSGVQTNVTANEEAIEAPRDDESQRSIGLVFGNRQTPYGGPTGRNFEVKFEGRIGQMIEYGIAPTDMQCGFFGMGVTREQAYERIRNSTDALVREAVVQTLRFEYGTVDGRVALDNYLLQTLGLTIGEGDFTRRLLEDQAFYEAVLKYFFEEDHAQLTFHPGDIGLLDALAIVLGQRVIVWEREPSSNRLIIQHDTQLHGGNSPNLVHLILENGHFNFLEFQAVDYSARETSNKVSEIIYKFRQREKGEYRAPTGKYFEVTLPNRVKRSMVEYGDPMATPVAFSG